jgi:hypothetical protein
VGAPRTADQQAARARIAAGRGALANRHADREETRHVAQERIAQLLALLWHADSGIRRSAALALAGGDRDSAYVPLYGHYAGTLLRGLTGRAAQMPASACERHSVVAETLRALLDQSAHEIRAMNNMRYSFLSSALYVALLSTCRDGIEAVRRLRVATAHPELCRLLWNLARIGGSSKLNAQDIGALIQIAAQALAALPPDEIPEFWRGLTHHLPPRRMVFVPVLAYMDDHRAVPHLTEALKEQPGCIALPIIECLGRQGDLRALAALRRIARGQDRLLRNPARTAITAIERANADNPARILLRAYRVPIEADPTTLLRPVISAPNEPPEELLRSPEP